MSYFTVNAIVGELDFPSSEIFYFQQQQFLSLIHIFFGLHVIMDFGANKTLTGGLALQTVETYKDFIGKSDISFGGNNFEIYLSLIHI